MYLSKTVLAICPARGGSKGLPGKNVLPLNGTPLTTLVGIVAARVAEIDQAVVSTDDEKIAEAAIAGGLGAPFRRPADLSGDLIGDLDVLTHALGEMEQRDGRTYDVVVMLQPTSPLRRSEQISAAIRKLVDENLDAVWSVSRIDVRYHPLKQLKVEDGRLHYYSAEGAGVIARQQLTPTYIRNGVVYAMTRSCLLDHRSIKGAKTGALVIEDPVSNIDTHDDFAAAEAVIREGRFPGLFD